MTRKEYYELKVKEIDDNRDSILLIPHLLGFGIKLDENTQEGDNPFRTIALVSQSSGDKKNLPKSLGDIPIVVEVCPEIQELNEDSVSMDEGTYNPLKGGIQLINYGKGAGTGTLGCFVKDANDRVYGLTNRHVGVSVGSVLYHPKKTPVHCCSEKYCNHDCCIIDVKGNIGSVKKISQLTTTDSAIIELATDVKWKNEIVDIGVVKGESTIAPEELLGQTVRKRGRTTCLTTGKIDICYYESVSSYQYREQIVIKNEGGIFAQGGDSGSVVVDKDDKVLALLWGGMGNDGVCNLIRPVLEEMGVTLMSGIENGIGTLLKANTRALASDLNTSPEIYTTLSALIDRHTFEVMHLVNHSRPVTVVWQRMKGPQYVQPLINAYRFPGQPLDSLLTDGSWVEVLKKMEVALYNNGSYRLRVDLTRYREMILKAFSSLKK
ncbi:Nal1-like putative serine protease [Bacteroides oleiciplenus]|uniref:Nal1 C-terminal domain-containing protein n=1 Tax=Bacteroides oleiciplenus YIT 12058 TaxID=742727 RepID=K9EPJ0_9BACE|nr:hypothetical protein [Bacteroides oleiciplenus]EKU92827.1 hypothetical protein HMPREF9447_00484 [Bacteroides oleiciplenus YIT 12058]